MASFRKRGDTWSYRLSLINPKTGKRMQPEKSGFKSERAAQRAATKLEAEILNQTYVHEKDISFISFAQQWLEMFAADGTKAYGTLDVRQGGVNRLSKHFTHKKIKDITKANYQNVLIELSKTLAHETLISTHATAKLLFRKAIELEVIKKNPTEYAVVPVKRKTVSDLESVEELPKYLEKEELKQLLRYAFENCHYQEFAQYHLLAYTGMRIGEMCVIKWSDIDFEAKKISITKTLYNNKNNVKKFKLVPPKTASSKREIAIDNQTMAVLKKQRAEQLEYKMEKRDSFTDHNFVFTNRHRYPGYPEMQKQLEARMKLLLPKCGLPSHMTPHTLRHTHVSILAEAGVSLETIQERLGHKDDGITRRVYQHITKTMKNEAAMIFESIMNS
ncbi:site-specific integrase [Paenibacillus wenxiniae]|uniref:Tyrosine-type recombinase/integrase n=1 Tax=Paenibacillus wenxiniae TaxID=1636843 RepID=A0ABW4RMN1_9BACL